VRILAQDVLCCLPEREEREDERVCERVRVRGLAGTPSNQLSSSRALRSFADSQQAPLLRLSRQRSLVVVQSGVDTMTPLGNSICVLVMG
jgi:hypothetical protein